MKIFYTKRIVNNHISTVINLKFKLNNLTKNITIHKDKNDKIIFMSVVYLFHCSECNTLNELELEPYNLLIPYCKMNYIRQTRILLKDFRLLSKFKMLLCCQCYYDLL